MKGICSIFLRRNGSVPGRTVSTGLLATCSCWVCVSSQLTMKTMPWLKTPTCIFEAPLHRPDHPGMSNHPKATFRDEGRRTLRNSLTTCTLALWPGKGFTSSLGSAAYSCFSDTPFCMREEFNEQGVVIAGAKSLIPGTGLSTLCPFTEWKTWPRNKGLTAVSQTMEQCPSPTSQPLR